MSSLKKLKYAFETSAGGGSATHTFDRGPEKKTFANRGASNGAIESADQEIKVHVQWDGKTEEFTLSNPEQS